MDEHAEARSASEEAVGWVVGESAVSEGRGVAANGRGFRGIALTHRTQQSVSAVRPECRPGGLVRSSGRVEAGADNAD